MRPCAERVVGVVAQGDAGERLLVLRQLERGRPQHQVVCIGHCGVQLFEHIADLGLDRRAETADTGPDRCTERPPSNPDHCPVPAGAGRTTSGWRAASHADDAVEAEKIPVRRAGVRAGRDSAATRRNRTRGACRVPRGGFRAERVFDCYAALIW